MESIGEKLRLAREKNNLTIEQIARDTHVARRFLKALEDEDFSVFPGETYAMGFLRNYAEYLGLSAEELINLYRNLKIQEQPLPMEQLLDPQPKIPTRLMIIIGAVVIAVLAGGGFLIWRVVGSKSPGEAETQSQSLLKKENTEFVFQEEVRTKWFKQGDVITVPIEDRNYRLEVTSVGDALTVRVPGGTVELTLGKERVVDLDSDSMPDVKIIWNDIDRTSAEKRANLGLYRVTGTIAAADPSALPAGQSAAPAPPGAIQQQPQAAQPPGAQPAAQPVAQPAAQPVAQPAAQPVAQPAASPTPTPTPAASTARPAAFKTAAVARSAETSEFTMELSFRDNCLFRFLVDDDKKEDKFFQKGEEFRLDAKDTITLWLSNAGAVKARIGGRDLDLGRLGEAATRQIAWRKDPVSGDYVLEIVALF